MARSRVKLDLGPHGKVLASVVDFEDAKVVAAGRFNVTPSDVQLFVSDGEDLWELHPSAFQDVVAENGVIVAKALLVPSSAIQQTSASTASGSNIVAKRDASLPVTTAHSVLPSATPTLRMANADPSIASSSASSLHFVRPRASSTASTSSTNSTSSTSSSSSSSSSSSGSSSSSSSSSANENRRSASIQDVTATSATVRTIIGPNGLPVSSKERWDPKTHRLMFEKLNEIISSETIYYTRKYTEERYRIFQLLIDHYGDMGVKGNFLRGRTAAALISRVAGVLRTARERGEKIKQPFKFFFPNKKDDEIVPRSATAPSPNSYHGNDRASSRTGGNGGRAQTQPAPANGQPHRRQSQAARAAAAVPATPSSSSTAAATARTVELGRSTTDGAQLSGKGRGKGKAPAKPTAQRTTSGQGNPPQIGRKTAKAAAMPRRPPSPARAAKRLTSGGPTLNAPHPKKQKAANLQSAQKHSAVTSRRAPSSSLRDRSASPRPNGTDRQDNDSEDERYSRRVDRSGGQSARRMRDSWIRARDEPLQDDVGAGRMDDRGHRWARRPSASLPARPTWAGEAGQHEGNHDQVPASPIQSSGRLAGSQSYMLDDPLFRAETRSSPPAEQSSRTRSSSGRWNRQASSQPPLNVPDNSRTRTNAVERALEHLASAGADVGAPPKNRNGSGGGNRRWGSPNRSWQRNTGNTHDAVRVSPDLRRSVARNQHEQQQPQLYGKGHRSGEVDNGWPVLSSQGTARFGPPRTPPRAE